MRFLLSLAVLGMVMGAGAPAFAQSTEGQPGYVYGGNYGNTPLYNSGGYRGSSTDMSLYNSGANLQMLPLPNQDATVAGKNAPSYSYNHSAAGQPDYSNQQYNSGALGGLSPEQARGLRMQREANAQAYQQQYLANQRQKQGANPYAPNNNGASQYQGAQFNQLYNANQQNKPAVKKKYLYKKPADPLTVPPPLFNVTK